MQPQGHVQVLLNKLRGFTPQACLDAPRFCISAGLPVAGQDNSAGRVDTEVYVEEGVEENVVQELKGELYMVVSVDATSLTISHGTPDHPGESVGSARCGQGTDCPACQGSLGKKGMGVWE